MFECEWSEIISEYEKRNVYNCGIFGPETSF